MMKKKKVITTLVFSIGIACCIALMPKNNSIFSTKADDCAHNNVNHYNALGSSLIKAGHQEYWVCCECHCSFSDADCTQLLEATSTDWTNPLDDRYVAPIGVSVTENIMYSGTESSEATPEGYAFEKVFEQSGYQGQFIFNDSFNIRKYSKVSFAVKGGVWFILRNSWDTAYAPNAWTLFELEQTSDRVWSIYSAGLDGEFKLIYSNVEGETIKAVTGFGGEASTYHLTNLRCIEKEVTTDIVARSSVSRFLTSDLAAPYGYTTSTKGVVEYDNDNQGHAFLADISMDGYDEVSFAFKTFNRQFCDSGWGNALPVDTWHICTISKEVGGTYASKITDIEGNVKFGYTGKSSFRDSLPYYNYGGDPMIWISTEVRGTKQVQTLDSVVVASNAIGANGATVTAITENAPKGFETVAKWDGNPNSESMHGMFYSDANLNKYSSVSFAIKTTGYFLLDGWDVCIDNCLWTIITLTNNNDTTWNLVATDLQGNVLKTANNLSSFKSDSPAPYSNYALNTIIYGNPGTGYFAFKKSGVDLEVYATELRGTLPGNEFANSAFGANGASSLVKDSEVAAPTGYGKVFELGTDLDYLHGQYYSGVSLRPYSFVRFALMTNGTFKLNSNEDVVGANEWMFFELTDAGNDTWDIVVTLADGTVKHTDNGLSSYKGDDPGVYTNYALNSLLYGVPGIGYIANKGTESLVVYSTELKGVLKGTEVDSCAIGGNNARFQEGYGEATDVTNPFGFSKVHKLDAGSPTTIHGQYYSDVSLQGYAVVRFAFMTNGTFNLDNRASVDPFTWMMFELTDAGSDIWNLKVYLADGTIKLSVDGVASFKGDDPGVYTNYALNAILYGIPSGYSANCTDANTVLYATEVVAL